MTQSEFSSLVSKAAKEVLSIKKLLNQQEGEHFNPTDIIIEVCKKYSIPYNVLDRLVNSERRDNEKFEKFTRVKDITDEIDFTVKNIVDLANKNFTTVLWINGNAYVRNTLMDKIIQMNESKLALNKKYS